MNIRIINARILTMEKEKPIFRGEIQIEGSRITYIGESKECSKEGAKQWDREIDAQGNLIMPGFKNAHTHSAMTFLRSHADDMKLDTWLNDFVFPAEAKLTGEDVYWLSRLAVLEYLTSGVTSAFDMYMYQEDTARAMREDGFRMVLCGSINDYGGTVEDVEKDYLKYNRDPEDLISYRMGFHAEYTTSRTLMEGLAALAEKYKQPMAVHCSETRKEVEECRKRTGMTPVAYMESLGLFQYGGTCFHLVHLDDSDYEILKQREIIGVTNPASNLKLASGIAPVKRMLDCGIRLGIGTDGAASNNCLDMFREMFLVTGLQKVICDDPEVVTALEVLRMATVNSAISMGLEECDVLAAGKKADLIMIDLQQPNMQPLHNIEKNLVFSGSKQNIKMTMIDGQVRYEDGKFYVGTEIGEIYEHANQITKRILNLS